MNYYKYTQQAGYSTVRALPKRAHTLQFAHQGETPKSSLLGKSSTCEEQARQARSNESLRSQPWNRAVLLSVCKQPDFHVPNSDTAAPST